MGSIHYVCIKLKGNKRMTLSSEAVDLVWKAPTSFSAYSYEFEVVLARSKVKRGLLLHWLGRRTRGREAVR